MSQISLTASMRSNLLSLQETAKLMSTTQERLASGKKVNSAIDNPSSYYTAQSLNNRANDLSALLDSMGQAISTIKAANEGIEAVTSFVEQAKAVANSAMDASDAATRGKYQDQFNELRTQIDKVAQDSGYKGVNLLGGNDVTLTVAFNEKSGTDQSKLVINGKDGSTAASGLNVREATDWNTDTAAAKKTELDAKTLEYNAEKAKAVDISTAITAVDGTGDNAGKTAFSAAITSGTKYLIRKGESYYEWTATATVAKDTYAPDITLGSALTLEDGADGLKYKSDDKTAADTAYNAMVDAQTAYNNAAAADKAAQVAGITQAIEDVTAALTKLRDMASEFGNNFSIVQTREDFTNNLINVLEEGADKLTLADMNEESANMLALQTRQQLAINSLSLASTAAQSVLKLF